MEEQLATRTAQYTSEGSSSSNRFLTLIEGTADAAFAVNAAGRIQAWNSGATKLFGFLETEVINVRCHEVLRCSDENNIECAEYCVIERAARDHRASVNFDLRLQTTKRRVWCNLSTLLASDPSSGARYAIHIVRPIEIHKRLEQALNEFVRTQAATGLNSVPAIRLAPAPRVDANLTSREVEVLKSMADGHSTRTIADQLNISSATVSNHIKHILTKLDAHTRLEAIRHAEKIGVI